MRCSRFAENAWQAHVEVRKSSAHPSEGIFSGRRTSGERGEGYLSKDAVSARSQANHYDRALISAQKYPHLDMIR